MKIYSVPNSQYILERGLVIVRKIHVNVITPIIFLTLSFILKEFLRTFVLSESCTKFFCAQRALGNNNCLIAPL